MSSKKNVTKVTQVTCLIIRFVEVTFNLASNVTPIN